MKHLIDARTLWCAALFIIGPFLFAQERFQNPGFENGTTNPFLQSPTNGAFFLENNPADVYSGTQSLRHEATGGISHSLPWFGSNIVPIGNAGTTMQLRVRAKASQPNTPIKLFIFSLDKNQMPQTGLWGSTTETIGTDWVEINLRFDCPPNRPFASLRLDNRGGAGVNVWWDNLSFFEASAPFPAAPGPYSHTAIQSGDWHDPNTWNTSSAPDNDAIVHIPAGIHVQVATQEHADLKFITVAGSLSCSTQLNTQLRFESMHVAQGGNFHVGNDQVPLDANRRAVLIVGNNQAPIDLVWDPKERSRGIFMEGSFGLYGADKTHVTTLQGDALRGTYRYFLATHPIGWRSADRLVVAGTQFRQGQDLEDDLIIIRSTHDNVVNSGTILEHDHISYGKNPIHIANVTRNIVIQSADTETHLRGHIMFRSNNVVIRNASFLDLGRTDKRIPLDDILVDLIFDPNGDPDDPPIDYTITPNPNPQNRRGRYPIHFHQLGADPNQAVIPLVENSVVRGTPGWGFVNHSSYVEFNQNVVYDFAGAGFVTEAGDELGSFIDNIAIRGTGVPGRYFPARQTFKSTERPQPLSDFGFGGDGFWFQGPALTVLNNVANSCNGSGMFWFGAGAVDISNNHYVGFPTAHIPDVYGHFPDFASHQYRTWNYAGSNNDAVIADLPILEFAGFQAYACLVGHHNRFQNHRAISLYNEEPFEYDQEYTGSWNQMRQTIDDMTLWNNETGLRIRYIDETDWSNLGIFNNRDYYETNALVKGGEFVVEVRNQHFFDITVDGYEIAGQLKDVPLGVSFGVQNYSNYINADTFDFTSSCGQLTGLSAHAINTTTASLSWSLPKGFNFLRFLIRYRPVGSLEWDYHTVTKANATGATLTGLESGTQYEVQALAGCVDLHKRWHSKRTFTTP